MALPTMITGSNAQGGTYFMIFSDPTAKWAEWGISPTIGYGVQGYDFDLDTIDGTWRHFTSKGEPLTVINFAYVPPEVEAQGGEEAVTIPAPPEEEVIPPPPEE